MRRQCALLERIQREEEREEHENRHTGRYRRIFPPVDRLTRIRYANLLANAYRIFLSGRQNQSLDLEIQRLYSCDLKVLSGFLLYDRSFDSCFLIYTTVKTTSVGDARLSVVGVAGWPVILTGWLAGR